MWNTHILYVRTCAGYCYSPDLLMENNTKACTQTQTHAHMYTQACGRLSFIPECTGVFWDWAECCQGKAVYVSICSVLFCAVLNMTHIKRLWVVLSLFERSCSLLSLNYWENVTHLCLGQYLGLIIDFIIYSIYSQYISIMSTMTRVGWNNITVCLFVCS